MDNNFRVAVFLASAVVHLQEHADTGHPLDLAAANSILMLPDVERWMAENKEMLPVRRDGK